MPNGLGAPAYGFNDAALLLNSIVSQATGRTTLTPTTLSDFISVGTTALSTGYDPLLNAISQVISDTIFSIRPYSEKFRGLLADSIRWGNHVRKLKLADSDFESDGRYYEAPSDFWDNGDSADMYTIKKSNPLQLNFYGQNVWMDFVTLWKDQIDVSMRNPEELLRFTSMITLNMSNRLAHARETMARAALANFIGGKNALGGSHIIHLVTEYNAVKGTSLTTTTVRQLANWPDFCRWFAGRVLTLSDFFTEYSSIYQQNVTGKVINQHTPKENQKLYILSGDMNSMITEVLSTTYHEELSRIGDYEAVNFWQAIDTPDSIDVVPNYMDSTGAIVTAAQQQVDNIVGVLFDAEAIVTTERNTWSAPTPFNAKGGYTNMYFHAGHSYANDFTEKGVIMLLD